MIIKQEDGTELEVFTAEEVQAQISKAVNGAVSKAKEKANKTSEDRIAELEAALAQRDRQDYTRSKMAEAGIDSSLAHLFNGADNEAIDKQIEAFSAWKDKAIEEGVKAQIASAKPIHIKSSDPNAKGRRSLSEIQSNMK